MHRFEHHGRAAMLIKPSQLLGTKGIYMQVYIHHYTHIYTQAIYIHIHIHIHTHIRIRIHTHIYTHIYTQARHQWREFALVHPYLDRPCHDWKVAYVAGSPAQINKIGGLGTLCRCIGAFSRTDTHTLPTCIELPSTSLQNQDQCTYSAHPKKGKVHAE